MPPTRTSRGLAWSIIEHHYESRNTFNAIHKAYEKRVKQLVSERGIPRADLRLNPEETRDLFDTWRLERLLEEEMPALAEAAGEFFRKGDLYQSKVSRIYHELAILREEHLSVREFPRQGGHREFARLFREVSEYYPQRLRRVRDLFTRAQKRLDQLLPELADDTIVLRSAYLFRADLWPDNPTLGLRRFLSRMFPEGAPRGFLRVARSFLRAGFHEEAAACGRMGVAAAGKEAQARSSRAQQLRETISELDRLVSRAEAERKALLEEMA